MEYLANKHFFIIIIGYASTVWINERPPVKQVFWWILRRIWRGRGKPSSGHTLDVTIKSHTS